MSRKRTSKVGPTRTVAAHADLVGDDTWIVAVVCQRQSWARTTRVTQQQYREARDRALAAPIDK